MTNTTDRYPSRVGSRPALLDRQDPVVWGGTEGGPLDQGQLDRFDRDGLLLMDTLFDASEVEQLLAVAEGIARRPDVRQSERTIIEPKSERVRSVFEVHRLDDTLRRLAGDERLAGAARQILGSD
ncbi:MAG: phytanoyl-CoA dioxygenase family protein, partial [Acidimicrobiales bacterium]|nr:phytanoyl-CoA dioxygenase family protein [Acidimicrobiales bacterium]